MKFIFPIFGAAIIFALGFWSGRLGPEETSSPASPAPTPSSRTSPLAGGSPPRDMNGNEFQAEIINTFTNESLPFRSRSAEVLSIQDSGKRYRALAALLEELDSDKAMELIEAIQENDGKGVDGGREWEMLFERWGQVNPDEAADFLTTADLSDWHVYAKDGAIFHLMKGWGQSAPEEALAFIDNRDDLKPEATKMLFAGWAARDPQAAASKILTDPTRYSQYLETVSQEMCRAGGVEAYLAWRENALQQFPDDRGLRSKLDEVAVNRLRFAPQEKLVAWAVAQSRDDSSAGIHAAVLAFNQTNGWYPQKSMDFIAQMVDAEASPQVLSYCIQRETGDNPERVGQWLNEQPSSPDLDPLRKTYALSLANIDPQSAEEWAKTLQNEEEQTRVLAEIRARAKRGQ